MLCKGPLPQCAELNTPSHQQIQTIIYGDAYPAFCLRASQHPSLCDDYGRSPLASHMWEKMGLKQQWHEVHLKHDAEVKRCIPAERLLELPLASSEKATNIYRHLGCSGDVPDFPHHNAAVNY
mmetsp:Transcript_67673/g.135948  ORF Transcript_67673/g.135948 Transcript_67673/m.135948 type:complete len:123 (+) Transcript_67673:32-400(+)